MGAGLDLERIDEDRAYLAAAMLTWFLTTSHREVRDKATKALACILSRRLPLAARLLGNVAGVNDLYVLERLLAACYGAALQGAREAGLGKLAQVVFDTIFANGKPPANTLLRDHARGIVEYATWCGVVDSSIDLALARPPYRSSWPIEPVPDELIKSYIEDRGRGVFRDAIVGSTVSDMGDFAKYVVDHKVNRWSPAKLGTMPLPTSRDIYEAWRQEFFANATADQREAFNAYVVAAEGAKHVYGYQSTPETERLDAAEVALQQTMTSDQWEDFRVRSKNFIRRKLFDDRFQDWTAHFDVHWGRRWICKRAHEQGWTSERFGNFDNRTRGYDRSNHRVERIGKKYQWLALYELLGRMADNLAFLGSPWREDDNEPPVYRGTGGVGLRDIDPSLLTTQTHYDGWGEWGKRWWVPVDPQFRGMGPQERFAWLEGDSDIINESSLIDLQNPKTGRGWLALSGFSNWRGYGVRGGEKELQRDTWFRLTCIVVHRKDQTKMIESLQGKNAVGGCKLPFGNLPRLLMAWLSTEAVCTQSRELVLGRSLAEFMRTLGVLSSDSGGASGVRTRLRNQMRRLFNAHVRLVYEDEHGEQFVSSTIADRGEFWWSARKHDQPSLWESKIYLGEAFFNEIIDHPVPLDMNILKAIERSTLGLDLYLRLTYRTFALRAPQRLTWKQFVPSVWRAPRQSQRQQHRSSLPLQGSTRVEEDQAGLAGVELHDRSGCLGPLILGPGHPAAESRAASKLISPFPASQRPARGHITPSWTPLRYPPRS